MDNIVNNGENDLYQQVREFIRQGQPMNAINLIRARGRNTQLELISHLARSLDVDIAIARDHDYDHNLPLDIALDVALDRARNSARDLANALDRALDRETARDRVRDRALDLNRSINRAVIRTKALAGESSEVIGTLKYASSIVTIILGVIQEVSSKTSIQSHTAYIKSPQTSIKQERILTIEFSDERKLTPKILVGEIGPYLQAITDLQHFIDKLKEQPLSDVHVRSISQNSPVQVDITGVVAAYQELRDTVVKWRYEHKKKLSEFQLEQQRLIIEEQKLKLRADAYRINQEGRILKEREELEIQKLRQEVEQGRLALEKQKFDLLKEKFQMATEITLRAKPNINQAELMIEVNQLISILNALLESSLEPRLS